MGDWIETWAFSREVAVLAAQVAPVLLIAFVVEVRALATRRAIESKDRTWLIWYMFGAFAVLMIGCLLIANGADVIRGAWAVSAWFLVVVGLGVMAVFVAITSWAAIGVATIDAGRQKTRDDLIDELLAQPGWRWLIGRRTRDLGSTESINPPSPPSTRIK